MLLGGSLAHGFPLAGVDEGNPSCSYLPFANRAGLATIDGERNIDHQGHMLPTWDTLGDFTVAEADALLLGCSRLLSSRGEGTVLMCFH